MTCLNREHTCILPPLVANERRHAHFVFKTTEDLTLSIYLDDMQTFIELPSLTRFRKHANITSKTEILAIPNFQYNKFGSIKSTTYGTLIYTTCLKVHQANINLLMERKIQQLQRTYNIHKSRFNTRAIQIQNPFFFSQHKTCYDS